MGGSAIFGFVRISYFQRRVNSQKMAIEVKTIFPKNMLTRIVNDPCQVRMNLE